MYPWRYSINGDGGDKPILLWQGITTLPEPSVNSCTDIPDRHFLAWTDRSWTVSSWNTKICRVQSVLEKPGTDGPGSAMCSLLAITCAPNVTIFRCFVNVLYYDFEVNLVILIAAAIQLYDTYLVIYYIEMYILT